MKIKICIADSQSRIRYGLRVLLEQQPGWKVTGEIADGNELVERLGRERPDLILLDWELPGAPGGEILPSLRRAHPGLRLIAMSGNPGLRQASLQAGADAFASKLEPPEHLLVLIRELCAPTRKKP